MFSNKKKKFFIISLAGAGFFLTLYFLPSLALASTNISAAAGQHWAWNDIIGWIDFYNGGTSNITVSASQLTGNASSSVGPISLDCGTAIGWSCSSQNGNYKVTNSSNGTLSGWAWNDTIGWISFNCNNNNWCTTSTYSVYIDLGGNLHGFAWSDTVGWISFNCFDTVGLCNSSNFEVVTSWAPVAAIGELDSTIFDTGVSTGAQINSVMWRGSLNGLQSQDVGFQFAAASSAGGPWTFTGPGGSTSTGDVYYDTTGTGPNTPIPVRNYAAYSGFRYFRYRIVLTTNSSENISPQVTGVSVDWSP